ncbi:hypothetical protein OUZ56_012049 [Daphnia magna]|uniref:Uncharacterized protein n=1 Tax=Daphnia magna TaxID=35525 RepID=A0ABQ9Z1Z3_9CRUS|nr:hypothetical protein OUZ56_012049 [Daphnia magna]
MYEITNSQRRTKRGCKKIRAIEKQFNILKTKAFRTADAGALSILDGSYPIDYRIMEIKRPTGKCPNQN